MAKTAMRLGEGSCGVCKRHVFTWPRIYDTGTLLEAHKNSVGEWCSGSYLPPVDEDYDPASAYSQFA
mgnify:CR=1 FL=1